MTQPHQQEMDFGVFATAAANHARRRNAPPQPDRDGLFDAEGVTIIAGHRQCAVEVESDLFADIQFKETKVRVTAIAPGRWDAVAALAACTRAHGNRVYEVDYATAKPTNPGGLDEIRIARVVGADGVRPYLSKKGRYFEAAYGVWAPVERPLETEQGFRETFRVSAGKPTWVFRKLFDGFAPDGRRHRFAGDPTVRRSLRALEDAGLVRLELGPRGGMATAKVRWTERAFLAPVLSAEDEAAMGMLA
ncbi:MULTISPECIES: hypothetical protein [Bradyrhizobium]|uniref:Uncharacterized protein n=1 Tax=Bradyrhizobium arachidis TaxID=858423 RepID=A0AAE7TG47_9BRAD|nr:hypothetical protein [Bradyrhizobium arachidis]QOZ66386.1 hypothetical protein WN72_08195 [Bradyrhizobium arachidis]SFV18325.1 hypothetical protein SAMN05192541_13442 [Bradyrhizobium arachidis]